eukprot:gb/GECG01009113.1/.p1 GENE.gb/GECG01009113.1/~~gb/GECG01009113.1/.p1  ORF type:complete len:460 (+),score=25.72 gb/GECG01009113.1/:1-1380(+)
MTSFRQGAGGHQWIGPPDNPYLASIQSKHLPLITKLRWIFLYWGIGGPILLGLYIAGQTLRGCFKLIQWTLWSPCHLVYRGCFRSHKSSETSFTEVKDDDPRGRLVPRWIRHRIDSPAYGTWMADILSYGRHHPFRVVSSTTIKLPKLKEVIVVLPGNPGTIHFYHTFMGTLAYNLQEREDILVMGIGHSHHSKTSVPDSLQGTAQRHSLESQIRHKIEVLKQIRKAHPHVRFVTVGHSVGSYMSLRIAEALGQKVTRKHILLFPTVTHIGSTPNGIKLYPLFCYGRPLAGLTASLLALLPDSWKQLPVKARVGEQPHCVFGLKSIIHSPVAQNCLYMAKHEMEEIRALSPDLVKQHKTQLVWYFSRKDGWNRAGDYNEVLRLVEAENVHLCNRGFVHAFVLDEEASQTLALDTLNWIFPQPDGSMEKWNRPSSEMLDALDWETCSQQAETVAGEASEY